MSITAEEARELSRQSELDIIDKQIREAAKMGKRHAVLEYKLLKHKNFDDIACDLQSRGFVVAHEKNPTQLLVEW